MNYCNSPFYRTRLITKEVKVGSIVLGRGKPVRVQSMTTTDTMDTENSVKQSVRMIKNGCEIVRLTAPSKKEAENLLIIRQELNKLGYSDPLVADIHFTPNAAEIAAKHVEKVRVNPGNFVDKKRFEELSFTDESYKEELLRIEKKLVPLLQICKENNTSIRIGTNHGSLSDRILSKYGDTPEGMVESALEFVRICLKHDFDQIVLSMKASNTRVMVQAYRLLTAKMIEMNQVFPLHLGVTEAGDGEDGRIKSAVGIGALLEDGIGDTIRVSLTEEPEEEIPVAKILLEKFLEEESNNLKINDLLSYDPYHYHKRESSSLSNIGGENTPIVVADLSRFVELTPASLFFAGYHYSIPLDKWNLTDQACDIIYIGENELRFEVPDSLGVLCDPILYEEKYSARQNYFPVYNEDVSINDLKSDINFIELNSVEKALNFKESLNTVFIFSGPVQEQRYFRETLHNNKMKNPIIIKQVNDVKDDVKEQLWTASQLGSSFIDGFGDGIWITGKNSTQFYNSLSFGILQASRCRISKTEYISCPSCGRTLFDLQETTAAIKKETSHLKGVKIGIMGCIVNGPGEMADADYGYVGSGPGKIHLYKGQEVMKKNVEREEAVKELISLIKAHGDWVEKP